MAFSQATLRTAVGSIVARAASAAVELGNFPLGACDVQCAFDNWVTDTKPTDDLLVAVVGTLAQLGWEF
jgi:hypothetical protein